MPGPALQDVTVLTALGGNPLTPGKSSGTTTEQFAQTRAALQVVMPFIRPGCREAAPANIQTIDEALRGKGGATIYPYKRIIP